MECFILFEREKDEKSSFENGIMATSSIVSYFISDLKESY